MAADTTESGNNVGQLISLRHPKFGNKMCCLFVNGVLQELNWFKQSYTSWFLGEYVTEAGMKKGDDPRKFRLLDDRIFIEGYPGYHKLLSIAENYMQLVCEIKEVGSFKFFRLDDSKVLAWLYHKVSLLGQLTPLPPNNMVEVTDTVSVLGEYVKDEPWLKPLSDRLRIDFTEATRKTSDIEFLPTATGSNLGPCNGSQ